MRLIAISLPSKVDIRCGDAFSLHFAEQLLTGWKLNVEVGDSWFAELKYEKQIQKCGPKDIDVDRFCIMPS